MLGDDEIVANVPSTYPPVAEGGWHMERSSSESSLDTDSSREPFWQLDSRGFSVTDSACFDTSSNFPDTDTLWFPSIDSSLSLQEPLLACTSQFAWTKGTSESNLLEADPYGDQGNYNMAQFYPIEPVVEEMTRTRSLALSESTLSDALPELCPANFLQCGSTHLNSMPAAHTCPKCLITFSRASEIEDHARETKHKPFACTICSALFSRQDALTRHRQIHESQKRYPCARCEKYRGPGAFRRRDHLRQHLRKKHRLHPNAEFPRHCPYDRCDFSARDGRFDGFRLRRDYLRHMRDSHGEEKHDCDVDGCDRKGKRGFARLSDLDRHRKLIHEKLE
jgi:hypothetical protein